MAAVLAVCLAQAVGSSAPAEAGVLASVRIEFHAQNRAVIAISPGLYGSSEPGERQESAVAWGGEGSLRVTYDSETDRLEAVIESDAGSTTVGCEGAVNRGFDKLDPRRFAPRVMGLLAETANRGADGGIELRDVQVGSDGRPRRLQDISAGAQSASQLLHVGRTMAHGFSLAGTIRLTGAGPSAGSPLTVEVRLLADQARGGAKALQPDAPEISDGTFTNSTLTVLPPLGTANPYPSQITIDPGSYLTGVVTSVVVGLNHLDHAYPAEIAALLVGPSGRNVELMRLACGDFDLLDADITFDDAALLRMPNAAPCYSGSWKPTRNGFAVRYPPPAPQGPASPPYYGQLLSDFIGDSPIGTWSLYLDIHENFGAPDIGLIDTWSLTLTTAFLIPRTGTAGIAAPYPSTYTLSGLDPNWGLQTCLVYVFDLTHTYLSDVHLLLAVPSGQTSYLVGDACPGTNAVDLDWYFDDYAAAGFIPGSPCASGTYRPTVLGTRTFPAPAPAGPYGRSLGGVSGTGVNGVWSLYALDDAGGDVGRIRDWGFFCSMAAFWITGDSFETGDLLRWNSNQP